MPAGKVKVDAKVGGKPTYATDYFKSDTEEQVWLGSPHIDNLVTVSLALGGEVWATRQRQLIAEKLAEKKLAATTANIEAYVASRSEARFSHGVCPTCAAKHYGDIVGKKSDALEE